MRNASRMKHRTPRATLFAPRVALFSPRVALFPPAATLFALRAAPFALPVTLSACRVALFPPRVTLRSSRARLFCLGCNVQCVMDDAFFATREVFCLTPDAFRASHDAVCRTHDASFPSPDAFGGVHDAFFVARRRPCVARVRPQAAPGAWPSREDPRVRFAYPGYLVPVRLKPALRQAWTAGPVPTLIGGLTPFNISMILEL